MSDLLSKLEEALADWVGEMELMYLNKAQDGTTPFMGKLETEELFRAGKTYLNAEKAARSKPRKYSEEDDAKVAMVWDALVAGGWSPPKKLSDAVTRILDKVAKPTDEIISEHLERVGAIEVRERMYGRLPVLPSGFAWVDREADITGEDFTYRARVLCSFPKKNGKVRYVVEDQGRIFVQRLEQIKYVGESGPLFPDVEKARVRAIYQGVTDQNSAAKEAQIVEGTIPEPPIKFEPGEHNAQRKGWRAFFKGHQRNSSSFPPARIDLHEGYKQGWDEAERWSKS